MGCVLWRCDLAPRCTNEMVCEDILCMRFLKHECGKCIHRDNCAAYGRLKDKQNIEICEGLEVN